MVQFLVLITMMMHKFGSERKKIYGFRFRSIILLHVLQVISPSNLFVVVFFGNRFSLNIFLQNLSFETNPIHCFIPSTHCTNATVEL